MKAIKERIIYYILFLLWSALLLYKYPPIMELVGDNGEIYTNYLAIFSIVCSVLTFLFLVLIGTDNLRIYAALMIIGFGLCYIIAFPPFSRPDEEFHFNETMAVSNLIMGEEDTQYTEQEYLKTGEYPRYYVTSQAYIKEIMDLSGAEAVNSDKIKTASDRYYGIFHPIDYVIPAVGITFGRLIRLRFTQLFWLGCMFNLLSYTILTILAMRIFPHIQELILIIAMIPMNLHQAASFSYDSLLLGMSYVFTAYVFFLFFNDKIIRWKETLILTGISAIFFPIKIVYITLVLIFWIISENRFESIWDSIIKKTIVTASPFLIFFYSKIIGCFINIDTSAADMTAISSGIEGKMEGIYGFEDILSYPSGIIVMFLKTIYEKGWGWIMSAFGYKMAGLTLYVSTYLVYAYIFLLIVAVWYYSEKMPKQPKLVLTVLAADVIGAGLILAAMLFGWTVKSSDTIEGVQGRYFMPLLLPLLASFHSGKHSEKLRKIVNTENLLYFCALIQVGVIFYLFYRNSL